MPSARWAITCSNCNKPFTHSEIPEPQHAIDYLFPSKPEVPADGQELQCPHCKSKGKYQKTDLWYVAGSAGGI